MIICTNCNHENPEGSVQCENCYAPLPQTSPCPHCGAFVQTNATFCGQCGYNLQSEEPVALADAIDNSQDLVRASDARDLVEEDAIPTENVNSSLKSPWDTETGARDFRLTSISALETADSPKTPAETSESSVNNAEPIEEVENLEEPIVAEEFSFDSNGENDTVEPILDTDLDLALEDQLPEMSDIEELEATTARVSAEIPEIPEIPEPSPLDELDTAIPELDVAAEIPQKSAVYAEELEEVEDLEELIVTQEFPLDNNLENDTLEPVLDTELDFALKEQLPEMSDIEELEATTAGLNSEIAEIPGIIEPSSRENLEVNTPQLEPKLERSEMTEPSLPRASELSAAAHSISSARPLNPVSESATQLQLQRIILSHVQTGTDIEIAQNLDIIRIGKPNNQIPPDIDVSGFPDANIVSRVHANIRVEGDAFFIEDLGSSNGTYINHKPLLTGNRHRLRFGDRISLGKGDLMTFIFKIIE